MSTVILKTFSYTGTNRSGSKATGEIEAPNAQLAQAKLRKQGIIADKIKAKSQPLMSRGIRQKDITFFTRQLGTMLKSGIPITQALDITAEGQKHSLFRRKISTIKKDIESGLSLHESLKKHPKEFDDLYRSLIESGELSGNLDTMLLRISEYQEKMLSLKGNIKKASFYPAFVLAAAFCITLFLLVKVVPTFSELFSSRGVELPVITTIVVNISDWLQSWWWVLIGFLVGAFVLMSQLKKRNAKFKDSLDALLLKLPLFGNLIRKSILSRFARTLATSFTAGVPMIDALDSCAKAANNAVYRKAILKVKEEVASGQQLGFAMKQTGVFLPLLVQMTAIGEESGTLDEMENKAADYFEEEVDNIVEGLLSMLEPAIMIILGGIVAVILMAIYLPIFDIGKLAG